MTDHQKILALADQCVKCGMCQTVCPTYRLQHHEAESPRGRIALIQGLLENRLDAAPGLIRHLDNCLQCRACEALCPSRVAYGRLINYAMAHLPPAAAGNFRVQTFFRIFNRLLDSNMVPALLQSMLWLARKTRLQYLGWRPGALDRHSLGGNISITQEPNPTQAALRDREKTPVNLFTGCMSDLLQQNTVTAAIRVLSHLGFQSVLPASRQCCGALHLRQGEPERSQLLQQRLRQSIDTGLPMVSLVSACSAQLREHAAVDAEEFSSFVNQHWRDHLQLRALPRTILVHEACSLRNGLREQRDLYQLLARIPEARIQALADNAMCCGAGGSYMLSHPREAHILAAEKVQAIMDTENAVVVSTNLGCALHLSNGLHQRGCRTPVLHPAQLLAELLSPNPVLSNNKARS